MLTRRRQTKKRSMCLLASRRFAKQAVAMATAIHGEDGPQIDVPAGDAQKGTKLFKGKVLSATRLRKVATSSRDLH